MELNNKNDSKIQEKFHFKLIKGHNPSVIFLIETKASDERINKVMKANPSRLFNCTNPKYSMQREY